MTARDLDAALRELAEVQHGLVSRAQVRRLGAHREGIARRLASTDWEAMTPRVLRLVGAQRTCWQRAMAAALDAGSTAVSHGSAAALWGLPGFSLDAVHVSAPRNGTRRRSTLARIHLPRCLPARHLTTTGGVPVTTVARTVFDLAGQLRAGRTERALDNALARRLTTLSALRDVAGDLIEHGRSGSAVIRRLLEERGAGYVPPASGLEARFLARLSEAGLPVPDRQVDVGGEAWVGRVDFAYRDVKVVIEVDSDRHHTAKLDAEADRRRDRELVAAGWRIVRVSEEQLLGRPAEAQSVVRAALAAARSSVA